ncbi:hypothetical protein Agabi119p4_4743 [Agaricus bisporus var. burnettii]|uniref:Uncharacterized protein n=1 Tax=Agaricus bisporus var. burnettii TaxID=192524 RepID=A0A8H7F403_AGABI|nr:hypothetical protein Agabi119p4_4743 [Agaricus bisporus var. burnettii]
MPNLETEPRFFYSPDFHIRNIQSDSSYYASHALNPLFSVRLSPSPLALYPHISLSPCSLPASCLIISRRPQRIIPGAISPSIYPFVERQRPRLSSTCPQSSRPFTLKLLASFSAVTRCY